MGMSTHVVGFKPPDEKWHKMKAVYDACKTAKVSPPKEVSDYFDGCAPDDSGVEVTLQGKPCVSEYKDDSSHGYEVDIRKLPPDVTIIRFYNAW